MVDLGRGVLLASILSYRVSAHTSINTIDSLTLSDNHTRSPQCYNCIILSYLLSPVVFRIVNRK